MNASRLMVIISWIVTAAAVTSGLLYAWTADAHWGWTTLVLAITAVVMWGGTAITIDAL